VEGEIGASSFACTDSDSPVTFRPLYAKIDDILYMSRVHSFVPLKTRHTHVLSCYLQRQILNVSSIRFSSSPFTPGEPLSTTPVFMDLATNASHPYTTKRLSILITPRTYNSLSYISPFQTFVVPQLTCSKSKRISCSLRQGPPLRSRSTLGIGWGWWVQFQRIEVLDIPSRRRLREGRIILSVQRAKMLELRRWRARWGRMRDPVVVGLHRWRHWTGLCRRWTGRRWSGGGWPGEVGVDRRGHGGSS